MKNKLFLLILCLSLLNSCWNNVNTNNKTVDKQEVKEIIIEEKDLISDNEKKLNEILKRSQDFSQNYWWSQTWPKDISDWKLQEVKEIKDRVEEKIEETKEIIENNENASSWTAVETVEKVENTSVQQVEIKDEKYRIKPFKDDLFSYKQTLVEKLDWNWKLIDFSVKRDVEDRDEIDVDKVFEHYIDRKTEKYREIKNLDSVEWFSYYEVTDRKQNDSEKKLITIYFHWKWWNKTWWINDETFWWNFNRIQNLMIENSWVYISTDTILWDKWISDHTKLLEHLKNKYTNAKIVLIWWSNWWLMLWDLVNNENSNKFIDWIILAWTVLDDKNEKNSTDFLVKNKIPVYIAHWNKDHIPFWPKETFLKKFLSLWWEWKVVIFNWWVHWTPIRMVDYKEVLNWMLEIFEQNN